VQPWRLRDSLRVLLNVVLSGCNGYPLLGAGKSSNSKCAIVGGLRAIAQIVAYETRLSFILLAILIPSLLIRLSRINPLKANPEEGFR